MKPFLLLLLPFVAAKKVVRSYDDYRTVILLGLASERTKQLMKNCKYPVEEIEWIIKERSVDLKIRSKTSSLTIQFGENEGTIHWTLNGTSAKMSSEDTCWTVAVNFPDQSKTNIDAAELISRYLIEILKPNMKNIDIDGSEDHSENGFVWSLFEKFDYVFLGKKCDPLPVISAQRLKFYLKEAKIGKLTLRVTVKEGPTFKYRNDSPTKQESTRKHLRISESDWVDFSHFFDSFNWPKIECHAPTSECINKVLKEWIGRNHEGPEQSLFDSDHVWFYTYNSNDVYTVEEVLKNINATELVFTEKERKQFTEYRDAKSVQIQRTCDETKATVFFLDDFLHMVIWTPKMLKEHADFS